MNKKINIAVFTSIRSEYGLLKPVIKRIAADKDMSLQLIVGGAHLNNDYGNTKKEILEDGFSITSEIDFLANIEAPGTDALSILQKESGRVMQEVKPDIVLILGDRTELIPVCLSALVNNIPIAHISGGEVTEGAVDNQIRNAVSKMAHLHFPATDLYKDNLVKMGEEPWRVIVSGEPGLDEISELPLLDEDKFYSEVGLQRSKRFILATFHPQTIDKEITVDFIKRVFECILSKTDLQILVTASNFDEGGKEINAFLSSYTSDRVSFVKSLGQLRYYSALKFASVMVGNSSSGIVESQSFNIPVVNVGNRQKGRLANANVINCPIDNDAVLNSVLKADGEEFRSRFSGKPNLYGKGQAAKTIVDSIKELANDKMKLLQKK